MALYTRKILHSYIWEELLLETVGIRQVEYLASEENQPTMDYRQHIYEW